MNDLPTQVAAVLVILASVGDWFKRKWSPSAIAHRRPIPISRSVDEWEKLEPAVATPYGFAEAPVSGQPVPNQSIVDLDKRSAEFHQRYLAWSQHWVNQQFDGLETRDYVDAMMDGTCPAEYSTDVAVKHPSFQGPEWESLFERQT